MYIYGFVSFNMVCGEYRFCRCAPGVRQNCLAHLVRRVCVKALRQVCANIAAPGVRRHART